MVHKAKTFPKADGDDRLTVPIGLGVTKTVLFDQVRSAGVPQRPGRRASEAIIQIYFDGVT